MIDRSIKIERRNKFLISNPIASLGSLATDAFVFRTRKRLGNISEVFGKLPNGVDFKIFNNSDETISYVIGQPGIPIIDATFWFHDRDNGSWHFERSLQETLFDESVVTHSYDSRKPYNIRDGLQVIGSCNFLIDNTKVLGDTYL